MGIDKKKIDRINELYRKSKAEGLTSAERSEQALLRREYVEAFKQNLRGQLNNIDIKEKDGSIVNLGEKYGAKKEIRRGLLAMRSACPKEERTRQSAGHCPAGAGTSGVSQLWDAFFHMCRSGRRWTPGRSCAPRWPKGRPWLCRRWRAGR